MHSKYPKELEILIAIDDDDIETIEFVKSNDFSNEYDNIRVFIFPRLGYKNIGLYFKELFKISTGDIIIPIGEDCWIFRENYDEEFLEHKDNPIVMSWHARLVITRKAVEKYDFVKNYLTKAHAPGADTILYRTSYDKGIYMKVPKWHGKAPVLQYRDKEHPRWELEDLSILQNIQCKELKINE